MCPSVAYMLYAVDCPHIPKTTHYFDKERTNTMKIHFAYYNQYKNGIDIAFSDNTLLFLSCAEAEKNLHTTPNLLFTTLNDASFFTLNGGVFA